MKRARPAALWAALLLSVLAHAFTLAGGWLPLPQTKADAPPLLVRLEPIAPVTVIKPRPLQVPLSKPVAKPATKRATTVAAAPATLKSDAPGPWALPSPERIEAPAAQMEKPEVAMREEPPAPQPEPVVVANAAPGTFAPDPAIIKTLPKRGRIEYNLNYYISDAPALVGRTVQTWEATEDTYKLDSLSHTVGLARLTRFGPRAYHSNGTVNERGLQPQSFTGQVVVRGKSDDFAAQFDWRNNALQFGRPAEPQSAALTAGSQDLLSFMYQLSLAPPPPGRLQMPITNGKRFERYEIDVFDEETIQTPLGALRTLPVKQVRRPGRESVEVWLAADYHYLPVRIVIINRDGTPGGEQVATAINIGEQ